MDSKGVVPAERIIEVYMRGYERFEINPLSTWLNERGKGWGEEGRRSRIPWRSEMKKQTWLTGKNALAKSE
jgi:hypothetical protein